MHSTQKIIPDPITGVIVDPSDQKNGKSDRAQADISG
jgi:hypothetical protein